MTVILTILKAAGIVLGFLLLLLLLVILVVLLIPVHYEISGRIVDPEGRETFDAVALKENACFSAHFSWLFHAVRGGINWPEESVFTLKILWIPISLSSLTEHSAADKEDRSKDRKRKSPNIPGRDSIRKAASEGMDLLRQKDEQGNPVLLHGIGGILKPILPQEWHLSGTVGLGDPSYAATMLEIEGFLLPITGGHIWILPEFTVYRFDLEGNARGGVQLIQIVTAAVRLALKLNFKAAYRKEKAGKNG